MGGLTNLGSVASILGMVAANTGLDNYAVAGGKPAVVADFASAEEYFRVGGAPTDFETMFDLGTTTAYPTSVRTMVDSDGLLKWGPHNYNLRSNEFTVAPWTTFGSVTLTANAGTDPFGGSAATRVQFTAAAFANNSLEQSGIVIEPLRNRTNTVAVWAKATTGSDEKFALKLTHGAVADNFSGTLTATDEWQLFTFSATFASGGGPTIVGVVNVASTAADILIAGFHTYTSDLGGMAPVPADQRVASGAAFATYVPTTTVERYLHRRGNYAYNSATATWAAHNILTYSALVNGSGWTHQRATLTANATTSPDGTANASSFVEDSSVFDTHNAYSNAIAATAITYTCSVYAKANTKSQIKLSLDTAGVRDGAFFNLSGGTVGTVDTGYSATITDAGSGWWLCSITYTVPSADNYYAAVFLTDGSEGTLYNGDGTSGVYLYGAHVYQENLNGMSDVPVADRVAVGAAFATYVPTTGTAVDPVLDTATSFTKKGIQIETEARTNLFLNSFDNLNGNWTVALCTLTDDQTTGIDGTTSMATLADDNGGGSGFMYMANDITATLSQPVTFSAIVKAKRAPWVFLYAQNFTTPANGGVWFDLATGTKGTESSGYTGGIEDLGGGLYRIYMTFTLGGVDNTGTCYLAMSETDGGVSANRDGTTDVYVQALQAEVGSTPSSYIPTSGATASRAADILTIPAANMSANTSAMSLQMDGTLTYADEGAAAQQTFLRWQTDANNYISLDLDTDSTDTGQVNANQAVTATVDTVVAAAQYTPGVNVAFNIASRHTSGAINVAKDGTAATADTTPTSLVDLSARNCELFQDAMGNIGQFRQWGVDLGDTGIATAST